MLFNGKISAQQIARANAVWIAHSSRPGSTTLLLLAVLTCLLALL